MVYQRLAQFISLVCSPFVLLPLSFLLILKNVSASVDVKMSALTIVFGVGIVPVLFFFLFLKITKRINDWELRVRRERHLFYFFTLICGGIMVYSLHKLEMQRLFNYSLLILGWFAAMALVNLVWKISAHTAGTTLFILTVIYLFGTRWWFLILLIPLVAWARVYRKNHTLGQTVGGVILSILAVLLAKMFLLI